jgi:protein-tyrosine phosphatase
MEKQATEVKKHRVSWIIDILSNKSSASMVLSNYLAQDDEVKHNVFGICAAPGKNLAKGRDGKVYNRDIELDVKHLKESMNVDVIVCLLNKYELRTIGVDLDKYQAACDKYNISLLVYPIVEMGVPAQSAQEFDIQIINFIFESIRNNKKVICHCRGGIGRAGTVAACVILKLKLSKGPKHAISCVRSLRDPRCVESRKQEDYIDKFSKVLKDPAF